MIAFIYSLFITGLFYGVHYNEEKRKPVYDFSLVPEFFMIFRSVTLRNNHVLRCINIIYDRVSILFMTGCISKILH